MYPYVLEWWNCELLSRNSDIAEKLTVFCTGGSRAKDTEGVQCIGPGNGANGPSAVTVHEHNAVLWFVPRLCKTNLCNKEVAIPD